MDAAQRTLMQKQAEAALALAPRVILGLTLQPCIESTSTKLMHVSVESVSKPILWVILKARMMCLNSPFCLLGLPHLFHLLVAGLQGGLGEAL